MTALDAADLRTLARAAGLPLDTCAAADLAAACAELAPSLAEVERLLEEPPGAASATSAGWRRARPADDPLGAIVRWCDAAPVAEGALTGLRVTVKDAIAVAGVPLTCGFPPLDGFVPDRDSVVVARLRAAGARVVATTNMDAFGMAAGGETSGYGPVRNPHDPARTAGGSSGGAAAGLAYADVDLAIGCDQGGSIRVPASWCGVLGLKPTHGLVPCTGVVGIEPAIDHVGPLARTVDDLARALAVLAAGAPGGAAPARAGRRLAGVRIGVLAEAIDDVPGMQPAVAAAARDAAAGLAGLGATVCEVSVPTHLHSGGASLVCNFSGAAELLAGTAGASAHLGPRFALALRDALAGGAERLSPQMQLAWLVGLHLARQGRGALRTAALRARDAFRAAYDRALASVDVLLMPTTPWPAFALGQAGAVRASLHRGWAMLANTEPFNLTGHPALSMPTAAVGGLPVGTMIVGRHGEEGLLLTIAAAWERAHGWRPSAPDSTRTRRPMEDR